MSDYDISIEAQIEDLHREAHEIASRARLHPVGTASHDLYVRRANAKVRQAARLRAQAGAE